MFIIDAEDVKSTITLGHKGETQARCVRFDIQPLIAEFGEGTWTFVHRRPGEDIPYVVTEKATVGNFAVWNITDTDTAIAGTGRAELRYYAGGTLAKTVVWKTVIADSLGTTGDVPDPTQDVLNKMAEYANAAQEYELRAKEDAEAATQSAALADAAKTSAINAAEAAEQSATKAEQEAAAAAESEKKAETYMKNAFSGTPEGYEQLAQTINALGLNVDSDGYICQKLEDE